MQDKLKILRSADIIVCAPLSGQANHLFAKDSARFINLMPWSCGQPEVMTEWERAWLPHNLPMVDRSRYLFGNKPEEGLELSINHPNVYDVEKLEQVVSTIAGS